MEKQEKRQFSVQSLLSSYDADKRLIECLIEWLKVLIVWWPFCGFWVRISWILRVAATSKFKPPTGLYSRYILWGFIVLIQCDWFSSFSECFLAEGSMCLLFRPHMGPWTPGLQVYHLQSPRAQEVSQILPCRLRHVSSEYRKHLIFLIFFYILFYMSVPDTLYGVYVEPHSSARCIGV